MRLAVRIFPVVACALLLAVRAHATPGEDAIAVIERLHAAVLELADTEPALSLEQRVEALTPVISETHDLTTMGRLTVRRFWRDWSEDQRLAFIETFERLSVTTYASRFSSVGPDTFEILSGEITGDDRCEVKTLIHRADAEPVEMNYELRLDGGGWRIFNVLADGVSELSLMGSEYFEILDSGALDDLIAELKSQIADL